MRDLTKSLLLPLCLGLHACADLPPASMPRHAAEGSAQDASAPELLRARPSVPEPPVTEPPPATQVPPSPQAIAQEPAPADPASDAFRDIAAYASFNDNMLRDEIARIETLPGHSSYIDLRLAVLLWMRGRPEHAARLDALTAQLRNDGDPRVVALAGLLVHAVGSQRGTAERATALESQLLDARRRIEQLRAKIDALKSLEKELLSRPEPRTDTPDTGRPQR